MKKVLVADDDAAILDSLSIILEFEGYEVSTTLNGATLLDMNEFPDLVLLDILMSGVDGRDICRQLKQNQTTSNIPVVLLSASKDIQQSALDAGAKDFLAKPFSIDDLLKKIVKNIQ